MTSRVRLLRRLDERPVAATTHGSFARGRRDGFSDIELVAFFDDDGALPATLPDRTWRRLADARQRPRRGTNLRARDAP